MKKEKCVLEEKYVLVRRFEHNKNKQLIGNLFRSITAVTYLFLIVGLFGLSILISQMRSSLGLYNWNVSLIQIGLTLFMLVVNYVNLFTDDTQNSLKYYYKE